MYSTLALEKEREIVKEETALRKEKEACTCMCHYILGIFYCHFYFVHKGPTVQSFRNPFDIARSSLLEQLKLMRSNFLHTSSSTAPNMIEEGEWVCRFRVLVSVE